LITAPRRVHAQPRWLTVATGKLQKFKLREPFWAGQERQIN